MTNFETKNVNLETKIVDFRTENVDFYSKNAGFETKNDVLSIFFDETARRSCEDHVFRYQN